MTQIIFVIMILSIQLFVPSRYFKIAFFTTAIILTVLALFWMHHRNKLLYNRISQNSIGKIAMNPSLQIDINGYNSILQNDIENIEFHYAGYLGENFLFKTLVYPRQQNHSFGTGNKLVIKTNSSSIVKYIFIGNKKEKALFYNFSKRAMQDKIAGRETTYGKRTYGGNRLNYKEIQILKHKIAQGKSI